MLMQLWYGASEPSRSHVFEDKKQTLVLVQVESAATDGINLPVPYLLAASLGTSEN
jgi:hypothetical protein